MENTVFNSLVNPIHLWVRKNISQVSLDLFYSEHLDTIAPEIYPQIPDLIDFIVQAFLVLAQELEKLGMPVKAMATIPLAYVDNTTVPLQPPHSFETIVSQLSDEPPSLYLLSWHSMKQYILTEEFRTPLSFPLSEYLSDRVDIYYRAHRYGSHIKNDWEFARGIYLEHYPLGRLDR